MGTFGKNRIHQTIIKMLKMLKPLKICKRRKEYCSVIFSHQYSAQLANITSHQYTSDGLLSGWGGTHFVDIFTNKNN